MKKTITIRVATDQDIGPFHDYHVGEFDEGTDLSAVIDGMQRAARPDIEHDTPLGSRLRQALAELPDNGKILLEWWMHTSFEDFMATMPKMFEYGGDGEKRPGSADLRVIGEGLCELMGWPVNEDTEAVAQELGCWFYLLGKSGRLISNYQQQQPGKADTWFDIGIYAKMARRIQETGNWP